MNGFSIMDVWLGRRETPVSLKDFVHDYAFEIKNGDDCIYELNCLAIKSTNVQEVLSYFQVLDFKRNYWSSRLFESLNNEVFISDPFKGWVLILGPGLSAKFLNEETEQEQSSKKFGEVCYFFYNSDSCKFKWSRYVDGEAIRLYCDNSRDEKAKKKYNQYLVRLMKYGKAEDDSGLVRAKGYPTEAEKKFEQYGEDTLGYPHNVQQMLNYWVIKDELFPQHISGYKGRLG